MQQINLLDGELQTAASGLEVKHFVMAWGVFAVLLLVFTSWQGITTWGLEDELSQAESDLEKLRAANEAERVRRLEPNDLRDQIEALALQQSEQDQLMALLRAQQQSQGFSSYLVSLAQAHVSGLWLSEIEIVHDTTSRVSLHGSTSNPSLVPKLLQNLSLENQFSGQRFQQLELETDEETNLVHFSLVSPDGDTAG